MSIVDAVKNAVEKGASDVYIAQIQNRLHVSMERFSLLISIWID